MLAIIISLLCLVLAFWIVKEFTWTFKKKERGVSCHFEISGMWVKGRILAITEDKIAVEDEYGIVYYRLHDDVLP